MYVYQIETHMHMHTNSHTYTHACTHTCRYVLIHAHTYIYMPAYSLAQTHTDDSLHTEEMSNSWPHHKSNVTLRMVINGLWGAKNNY